MSTSALANLRAWLPKGNTLSDDAFRVRHLILRTLLLVHVPALFLWALAVGIAPLHALGEVALPLFCWLTSGYARNRRIDALLVTAGLVWCSLVLVHVSNGSIEAHFHFFIIIPFITLYQDWVPFLYAIAFTVISHGMGSWLRPDLIFNHDAAVARPWTWSVIHGVAVALASAGGVTFWRAAERERARATDLATSLAVQHEHAVATEAGHRTFSDLLVTLARRNQNLIERQLRLIDTLEHQEQNEGALANLFRLDHFATRMRRNAESLIVLSGAEAPPRLTDPQPLSEVIRGAVGEIEDYQRVDLVVSADPLIAGRAVLSIAHLLAELIENATVFSPSSSRVTVVGRSLRDGGCAVEVVDSGIGMSEADLDRYNERLADPPEVDVDLVRMLGLHVVGRLAGRHDVAVGLDRNSLGGLTATVAIPASLLAEAATASDLPRRTIPPALHDPYGPFERQGHSRAEQRGEWATPLVPRPTAAHARPAASPVASAPPPSPARRPPPAPSLRPAANGRGGSEAEPAGPAEGGPGLSRLPYGSRGYRNGAGAPALDHRQGGEATRPGAGSHQTAAGNGGPEPQVVHGLPYGGEADRQLNGNERGSWPPAEAPSALTRRVPMANLAPALRDGDEPENDLPAEARRLSSFQSGVQRARAANDGDDAPPGPWG
ncbi:MAG: hypothetical protein GEV08_02405 [Acidimicrobiia bacterium]|nr:hypothetical protein [Acidimicrobiia bacterium]